MTNEGKSCGQTVSAKGRRCRAHTEGAAATLRAGKKKVIELMTGGMRLIDAARELRKDPATIYRWRAADADFNSEVSAQVEENDAARTRAVEQTLYDDILDGKASPAERIFWLTNRDRVRWKNRHSQETLGADGNPVEQIPFGQMQAVAAKIDQLTINLSPADLAAILGVKAKAEVPIE